jgi:hypothetical protein
MPNIRALAAALALGALSFVSPVVGSAPLLAQQADTPTSDTDNLIGRAVYTSDGEQLGEVVQLTAYAGQPAVRAEIGKFLGLGTTTVIIPTSVVQRKAERLEVGMTAAEVRETIAKQQQR